MSANDIKTEPADNANLFEFELSVPEQALFKGTVNINTPWSQQDIEIIKKDVFGISSQRLPTLTFTEIAIKLRRTPLCVQQKTVELLDEENKAFEGEKRDAYEKVKAFLLEPIEDMAMFISANDLVFDLAYNLTGSAQYDRYFDSDALEKMIEADFSINEIRDEVNYIAGANVVGGHSIGMRVACLRPDSRLIELGDIESLLYYDFPINELARYFDRVNPFSQLKVKTFILHELVTQELSVNEFGNDEGFTLNTRFPLDIDYNYLYLQANSELFGLKSWNAQDSLTLKLGVLRGDSIFNIAQKTKRTPLSLLFQLMQRPLLMDRSPIDSVGKDIEGLIERIASIDPDTPIKNIATAQQLKDLSSCVLVVRDYFH